MKSESSHVVEMGIRLKLLGNALDRISGPRNALSAMRAADDPRPV